MVTIGRFQTADAAGVARLCQHLGWPTYSDPTVAARGCVAPGVHTVVARDADDLWRITEQVLAIPGVQRTDTALSLRRFVEPRLAPLIERIAATG